MYTVIDGSFMINIRIEPALFNRYEDISVDVKYLKGKCSILLIVITYAVGVLLNGRQQIRLNFPCLLLETKSCHGTLGPYKRSVENKNIVNIFRNIDFCTKGHILCRKLSGAGINPIRLISCKF